MKIISTYLVANLSIILCGKSTFGIQAVGDSNVVDDLPGQNFLRNGDPTQDFLSRKQEGWGAGSRRLVTCPTTYATCQTRPTLQKSSTYSASVVDLQCLLNQKNAAGLTTDGYFGTLTDAAVRAWQKKMALTVDGIVGCNTWKSLCTLGSTITYTVSPPSSFCPSNMCFWPSNTYITQVKKIAFNSGTSTYADLAKSNAATYGVHPGLLTAHMVRETSMGTNNKCVAINKKTALTGCGWISSCSKDCSCSTSAVWSDQGQVSCTAQTDKNAYNEAKTGKVVGGGAYTKCSSYNYNEDLMWKCIFCVYQGNYNSDITNSNGQYFTKDFTCAYAESMKGEFCAWKEYFLANK